MTQAYTLGRNCKSYLNTGSYGSPTWSEIVMARDVNVNKETETTDASTREAGLFGLEAVVALKVGVTLNLVRRRSSAVYNAIEAAWWAAGSIDVLILDGPVGTTGSDGVRAICNVKKMSQGQPLKDIVTDDVELVPTLDNSQPAPARFTAP